jgi:CBS-domain-containing membrane protein
MGTLPGRLGTLTARDVMTKDVIAVREDDTLEKAIQTLKQNRITGAPVIGKKNKFVGILSINDLIGQKPGVDFTDSGHLATALAHAEDATTWDLFDKASPLDDRSGAEQVATRMSRQMTSVADDTPLVEVARVMCGGHWHRVPVVGESGDLIGIISTMDILAAIVNVTDELA